MTIATLKEVDGSVVLPLTPELLAALSLAADSSVECDVQDGQLIVHAQAQLARPRRRSRYTLDELLAEWDQMPRDEEEDRQWINAPRVGRELI